MKTLTLPKSNMITKQKRLSKVWAKWFQKNRKNIETWLQDGRDDRVSISVVILKEGETSWSIGSRGNAWDRAIHTYDIRNDWSDLSDLDRDFIDVFGKNADVW